MTVESAKESLELFLKEELGELAIFSDWKVIESDYDGGYQYFSVIITKDITEWEKERIDLVFRLKTDYHIEIEISEGLDIYEKVDVSDYTVKWFWIRLLLD